MKAVIQRVQEAAVSVGGETIGSIGPGMVVLLGIGRGDTSDHADALIYKLLNLRIFNDSDDRMNLSALETGAEFLVISQFTLFGDCNKGRRPGFDKALNPKSAEVIYHHFVERLKREAVKVATGEFGAMMRVHLVNDGPVTFVLDTADFSS